MSCLSTGGPVRIVVLLLKTNWEDSGGAKGGNTVPRNIHTEIHLVRDERATRKDPESDHKQGD